MDLDQITQRIIDELLDRSGFDHWWDEIDEKIQQEIKDKISAIIEEGM